MNNVFIIHFLSTDEVKISLTRENMWESKNTSRIRKEQCYCYDRERANNSDGKENGAIVERERERSIMMEKCSHGVLSML